jgi:hypothetical protein
MPIFLPLTRGHVAVIDDEDAHLAAFKWRISTHKRSCTLYAIRWSGPRATKRRLRLHREVLGITDPLLEVDHVNGDGLDCRRGNLRIATRAQNQRNRTKQRNNTSGFKGVYWNTEARRWLAQIKVERIRKHIGYYATAEEAARAYDAAALRYHGEFARLNFPARETA